MSRPLLLFAVHNHQPVGNFGHVVRAAFADCYAPLLEALARHPGFRFALHFSGPLWEDMERNERGTFDLVRELARRGQVELLGGGFYEPVLTMIPEADRLGQVRMMNDYLAAHFGRRPRGLWLTERVWEPSLPKTLAEAGIAYTLLDEEHFRYAGVRDIHASYATEEEGRGLRVFPIDKALRYLIPFRPLAEVEAHLRKVHEAGGTAILGDDGEKFGVWPGTRRWVYEDGWLRDFLAFIEDRGIQTMTFADYLETHPPAGRIYLPPASYEEMMEWVLEPDDQISFAKIKAGLPEEARRFLRGGLFRDFLRKYPEANRLHKRMLMVSEGLREAGVEGEALRHLYRAQCNDPYWHGVFGGLYLPHLRESAYRHLLEAEKAIPDPAAWTAKDYDGDGFEELFFRDRTFGLIVKPGSGGTIVEIDHRPGARNLSDVLSRRREAYHQAGGPSGTGEGEGGKSIHEIGKSLPPEAAELLRYDPYTRVSLIDHFFPPGAAEDGFRRLESGERGDFIDAPFAAAASGAVLRLERRGTVEVGPERLPVAVRKTVACAAGALRVGIEIANLSGRELRLTYGSEWNILAFPTELDLGDGAASLYGGALRFEPEAADALWLFPLRTLSQSEGGFDIIHQGYCLCPVWSVALSSNGTRLLSIVLKDRNGP
jgi:alpha-amylase/alpha-mannosidase (GH57 family)